jgi:Putative lumazine-binding
MSSPPTESTASPPAADAVRAVALDYIEGWYAGDAERMERSLHDDLVKRTPLGEDGSSSGLRIVSKARMVELTSSGGGSDVPNPAIEVHVDDVSQNIACARTVCADFVDYLHLVETPDGWKIANIVFRNIDRH